MQNKTVSLSDIFILIPGIASAYVDRVQRPLSESYIPYIRPSYKQYSSIDAYVNKKLVPEDKIFPAYTLYVSTDGQGSHTFSYVSVCEFVPNSNITVLMPKKEMSLAEKLFYAQCITRNRYKFSYGRKPKGVRLETIKLPKDVPTIVQNFSIENAIKNMLATNLPFDKTNISYHNRSNNLVELEKLFFVHSGISSNEVEKEDNKLNESWIPFIRPSYKQDTSIAAYVNKRAVPQAKIFPAGTLYVSTNGQGSHTFSYVSVFEFVPNSDVSVLIPKREMCIQEKLFYAQCITNNRYKFSYGRKPKGKRLSAILLPEYPPDYVLGYDIEKVMKNFSTGLGMFNK